MTRPMPGPPEHCYCRDGDQPCRSCLSDDGFYPGGVCPGCYLHNGDRGPRETRLTDKECWTEYHHADAAWAKAMVQVLMGHRPMTDELNEGLHCQIEETGTWHRFATHRHALEES